MNMVRYEPWNLLGQLHSEIDQLFTPHQQRRLGEDGNSVSASDWTPAVDIREENDRFVIHADIPGVDPKDIELNMENGILSIKGQRESETKENREGYKRVERVRGTFFRRFSLPDTTNVDEISARCEHGVLEVVIPKQEKVQPRRIQVTN